MQFITQLIHFANAQTDAACIGLVSAGGTCDAGKGLTGGFQTIANTLIFIVGAISVLMVIIGALRYVLSGGDSAGLKSAKDTILYALIGVVVAMLSYALVAFVIGRF